MGTAGRRLHRPHPQGRGRQPGEHGAHHAGGTGQGAEGHGLPQSARPG